MPTANWVLLMSLVFTRCWLLILLMLMLLHLVVVLVIVRRRLSEILILRRRLLVAVHHNISVALELLSDLSVDELEEGMLIHFVVEVVGQVCVFFKPRSRHF